MLIVRALARHAWQVPATRQMRWAANDTDLRLICRLATYQSAGNMGTKKSQRLDGLEDAPYRELRLLEEVESTAQVSQRHLARQLDVALGVANLLVRNLAKKGYIRITQVGWRRWVYVVTPAGLSRKIHLTVDYVQRFLNHYRRVRTLLREDLGTLAVSTDSRIAVYGTNELTELVYLGLREVGITRIEFFDRFSGSSLLGMPVKGLDSLNPDDYDRVIVTPGADIEARRGELLAQGADQSRIVTLLQQPRRDRALTEDQHEA